MVDILPKLLFVYTSCDLFLAQSELTIGLYFKYVDPTREILTWKIWN